MNGRMGIRAIGTYIPAGRESAAELLDSVGAQKGQLGLMTRIHNLHKVAKSEDTEDLKTLLGKAVNDLRDRGGQPQEVDLVIFAHSTLTQEGYDESCLDQICDELGLGDIPRFGISHLNCASGIGALALLNKLREPSIRKVLLLVADRTTGMPDARYVRNSTLVGDSAAAIELEWGCMELQLLSASVAVDPTLHEGFWADDLKLKEFGKTYLNDIEKVIDECLAQAGLGRRDLNWILPHNVNETTWRKFCENTGFPREKVYLNLLSELGHSYCNDGPLNLVSAMNAGVLNRGDNLLMVNVGLGSYFGAAVFRY